MGWKLDVRSAVVGAGVMAIAAFLLGAAKAESAVGRYQASVGANRAVLVDTMTGQVWEGEGRAVGFDDFYKPKTDLSK